MKEINPKSPLAPVEVTTVEGEIVSVKAYEGLKTRVADLVQKGKQFAISYVEVVSWIKDNQIPPKVVRSVCAPHFPPPRISEFCRVAALDGPQFDDYKQGRIGFRAALEKSRDSKKPEIDRKKKLRNQLLALGHKWASEDGKPLLLIEDSDLLVVVPWFDKKISNGEDVTLSVKGYEVSIKKR